LHTKYSKEQCLKILNLYENGTTVNQICSNLCLPRSSVYYIIKKERGINNTKPTQKELLCLQQRLDRQLKINQIQLLFNRSPLSKSDEKIRFIKENLSNYSLSSLCTALGVSKSSYYLKADESKKTTYEKRREELLPIITDIFNEHNQALGALKISKIMQQEGYHVSPKTVADIMHTNGMFSVRSGSKRLYMQHIKTVKNTLNRKFNVSKPNEAWVADVSEFVFKNQKYFLSTIMDLFSRRIISWKIGYRNTTQLIKTTFLYAYEVRKPDGILLFHSDRGGNYKSKVYCECLYTHGVIQSMSNPSQPYDNSVKESFFSSFKQEEIYRRIYHSEKEMFAYIEKYIDYYNNNRPHGYLHYKTPAEAERAFFENDQNNVSS